MVTRLNAGLSMIRSGGTGQPFRPGNGQRRRFPVLQNRGRPGPSPQAWNAVGQPHHSPVVGGVLENSNSGAYPPGTYTLRLEAVDNAGSYPERCSVTVVVKREFQAASTAL
jgi:hypothetical protein